MSDSNLMAILADKIKPLIATETIVTEAYTLHIKRDRETTWYQYTVTNHWTDTVGGSISVEVGDRFGEVEVPDKVTIVVSNSSGGRNDDWVLDDLLHNVAAIQDLHARLSDTSEEVARICERSNVISAHERLVFKHRVKIKADAVKANPPLDDKELKIVIKRAANLGKHGRLIWTVVGLDGELHEKSTMIDPKGVYLFGRKPEPQKKILERLTGRATSISINDFSVEQS